MLFMDYNELILRWIISSSLNQLNKSDFSFSKNIITTYNIKPTHLGSF